MAVCEARLVTSTLKNTFPCSLEFVKNSGTAEFLRSSPKPTSAINNNRSLLELTSSFENDSALNSFAATTSPDSGFCYKMSSDSAFQSLGDGIELEDDKPSVSPSKLKHEPSKLELQMKAIAEEAKKRRLGKGLFCRGWVTVAHSLVSGAVDIPKHGRRSAENRFMTQPVTVDEVQEAAKLNPEDPAGRWSMRF